MDRTVSGGYPPTEGVASEGKVLLLLAQQPMMGEDWLGRNP